MGRIATHVILVPLLSDDPITLNVLVTRFCVAFTATSRAESSKSWLMWSSIGCPLTSQLMNVAMAVQFNTATSLSEIFMGGGGITISIKERKIIFFDEHAGILHVPDQIDKLS